MDFANAESFGWDLDAPIAGHGSGEGGAQPDAANSHAFDSVFAAGREALHRELNAILPRLRRYALALTHDPVDADDLVQDCFARALGKLHLWKPDTDLRAWLFTILHHEHINRIRHESIGGAKIAWSEHIPAGVCPSAQVEYVELAELQRDIRLLPESQRTALLLASLTPWNYAQIAAACDVPVGTIRSRLGRGRAMLRKLARKPMCERIHRGSASRRRGGSATLVGNAAEQRSRLQRGEPAGGRRCAESDLE
jgi:RNA polymerase sigma factor (sigma-70 family)